MLLLLIPFHTHAKKFNIEGSDLLTGVGAQAIGLSGAVAAGTTGVYSVFWNPAGLVEMQTNEVSLSRQINAKILPLNFASIALRTSWLDTLGLDSAIALSWIPRLHVQSTGAYTANDIESIFLRFALPNLPGSFSGDIESKTKDVRLTFAIKPTDNAKWSLGVSVAKVDCETFFCGTTAREPGKYIITSTKASAYAFGIGAKYFYSPNITFGFNLKDIDTSLDVATKTVYEDNTSKQTIFKSAFPKDLTLGAQWLYQDNIKLSLDYQKLFGNYGSYALDFQMLRAGLEIVSGRMAYRLGFLSPLKLSTGKSTNYTDRLLYPIAPSIGIGWRNDYFSIDAALYPQLILSAQRKEAVVGLDVSITSHF